MAPRNAIPPCEGHKSWTDWGWEYACGYDAKWGCDSCICVTAKHDDLTGMDPTTGKKFQASK